MVEGIFSAEITVLLVSIIIFIFGLIIGYLAQRSGFCTIAGIRDLLLFKHTRLFLGYLTLISAAFLSYLLFWLIIPVAFPNFYWAASQANPFIPMPGAPEHLTVSSYIILAVIGGFGMGFIGVLLGGCPIRQTVMAGEGNIKSIFFIIGLVLGAIIFYVWILQFLTL